MKKYKRKRRRTFKKRFEKNFALGIISTVIIGFVAGIGTYWAASNIAQPESFSKQEIDTTIKEKAEKNNRITALYNKNKLENDSLKNEIELIKSSRIEKENKVSNQNKQTNTDYTDSLIMAANPPSIINIGGKQFYVVKYKGIIEQVEPITTTNIKLHLGKDTTICKGNSITLNAAIPDATYLWQDGSTDPSYNVKEEGKYWVKVFKGNSTIADTINIKFLSPPKEKLIDTTLCNRKDLFIDASTEEASYIWNDNSSKSFKNITDPGKYWVSITNPCGSITDTIKVNYHECNCDVLIPKAFTPNDDSFNDQFSPVVNCDFLDKYDFRIFSPWGVLLFKTDNAKTAWDGSYNGKMSPSGDYIWVLNYSRGNEGKIVKESKHGTVSLFK